MDRNKKISTLVLFGLLISLSILGQNEKYSERYANAYKKYLSAACPLEPDSIKHFVYFARDRELIQDHPFLNIPRFVGAQIMYSWKQLEPEKGKYDFSIIQEDYKYLLSHGKKLFIQFQDASFTPQICWITWISSNR